MDAEPSEQLTRDTDPVEQPTEDVAAPAPDVSSDPPADAPTDDQSPADAESPVLTDWRRLDDRFLTTERIGSVIFSGLLMLGATVPVLLDLVFGWWGWIPKVSVYSGYILFGGILWWASIPWPRMQIAATSYRYGTGGIEIRRGVWWKRRIRVPRSRMQHTDVTQGPLLRKYGLASLTVHTAATNTPAITLSGMTHEDAMSIRNTLTNAEDESV